MIPTCVTRLIKNTHKFSNYRLQQLNHEIAGFVISSKFAYFKICVYLVISRGQTLSVYVGDYQLPPLKILFLCRIVSTVVLELFSYTAGI